MSDDHSSTTTRHESNRLDDAVAFRMHRTNRLLRTHLQRFLDTNADGLGAEQWFILVRLHELGPLRQVDLAEPVLGDPPNVSRLVDGLQRHGWVERRPDESDRRSWLVALTPTGRRLTRRLLQKAVDARLELFGQFDDSEIASLISMLDRIDATLRTLLAR